MGEGARRIGSKVAGRLCAVCNKRTGDHTYGFRETLRANGIIGDKAHVRCVQKLKGATMKRARLRKEDLE
jgi:hypothetical protein